MGMVQDHMENQDHMEKYSCPLCSHVKTERLGPEHAKEKGVISDEKLGNDRNVTPSLPNNRLDISD